MGFLSRRPFFLLAVLTVVSLTAECGHAYCGSDTVCTCPDCPKKRIYRQARWCVVETDNFQVCCEESHVRAEGLARHAETLRTDLRSKWLAEVPDTAWSPKCQIVLHSELRKYVA